MTIEKLKPPSAGISYLATEVFFGGRVNVQAVRLEFELGEVAAVSTGLVLLRSKSGAIAEQIDPQRARKIGRAFLDAAYHAERRAEAINGHHVPFVTEGAAGQLLCRYHGRTGAIRLSKLRRPRACGICRAESMELWIPVVRREKASWGGTVPMRDVEIEICQQCVGRHKQRNTGLRLVGGKAEGQDG